MFGIQPQSQEVAAYVALLEGFNSYLVPLWLAYIAMKWIRRLFFSV